MCMSQPGFCWNPMLDFGMATQIAPWMYPFATSMQSPVQVKLVPLSVSSPSTIPTDSCGTTAASSVQPSQCVARKPKPKHKLCVHGRRHCHCKPCGGASVCEHGRLRSVCRQCGGGSICEHGKRRTRCDLCLATMYQTCEHLLVRSECSICVSTTKFRRFRKKRPLSATDAAPGGTADGAIMQSVPAVVPANSSIQSVDLTAIHQPQ